jgi:hypothetical protein
MDFWPIFLKEHVSVDGIIQEQQVEGVNHPAEKWTRSNSNNLGLFGWVK